MEHGTLREHGRMAFKRKNQSNIKKNYHSNSYSHSSFELGFEGKKKDKPFVIVLVTYNHQIWKLYMFVLGFSLLHQCWWLVSPLSQCFIQKCFPNLRILRPMYKIINYTQ
jgi:hypothetical protein